MQSNCSFGFELILDHERRLQKYSIFTYIQNPTFFVNRCFEHSVLTYTELIRFPSTQKMNHMKMKNIATFCASCFVIIVYYVLVLYTKRFCFIL